MLPLPFHITQTSNIMKLTFIATAKSKYKFYDDLLCLQYLATGKTGSMNFLSISVYILLSILYIIFFGVDSIKKYLEGGIMITKAEAQTLVIVPPVIMIAPKSSSTGGGAWKMGNDHNDIPDDFQKGFQKFLSNHFCGDEEIKNITSLVKCLKNITYPLDETMLNITGGSVSHDYSFKVSAFSGLIHYIRPHFTTFESNGRASTLTLKLNPKLNYFVAFADPSFLVASSNPSSVPYDLQKFEHNSGNIIIYLKVGSTMASYFVLTVLLYTLICRQCNINCWTELDLVVWQVRIILWGAVLRGRLVRVLDVNLYGSTTLNSNFPFVLIDISILSLWKL